MARAKSSKTSEVKERTKPVEKFTDDDTAFLNPMYESRFEFYGTEYLCAEAAYGAALCVKPDDAQQFIGLRGRAAHSLIAKIPMHTDKVLRCKLMWEIVNEKFRQNKELCDLLLLTGKVPIFYRNNFCDAFFGISNATGLGENILGRMLMELRRVLREERDEVEKEKQMREELKEQAQAMTLCGDAIPVRRASDMRFTKVYPKRTYSKELRFLHTGYIGYIEHMIQMHDFYFAIPTAPVITAAKPKPEAEPEEPQSAYRDDDEFSDGDAMAFEAKESGESEEEPEERDEAFTEEQEAASDNTQVQDDLSKEPALKKQEKKRYVYRPKARA